MHTYRVKKAGRGNFRQFELKVTARLPIGHRIQIQGMTGLFVVVSPVLEG